MDLFELETNLKCDIKRQGHRQCSTLEGQKDYYRDIMPWERRRHPPPISYGSVKSPMHEIVMTLRKAGIVSVDKHHIIV